MDGINDPLLAEKLKLLREMEDRIHLKKALIAKKSVELSTNDTRNDDEQSCTSKRTPLRDRVHFVLQQRETSGFLSKLAAQRERATLSCLSEDPVTDHPLKMRVKALMRRRCIQQKELVLHSPPSHSPRTHDDEVERGFDFFLSLLNNGVDMECDFPPPRPQKSVSPPSHCDKVHRGTENFHRSSSKEVPDSAPGALAQTESQAAYQKKASEDTKHFRGLPNRAMDKVPDAIPSLLQRSCPPIQKENVSTDIHKKEDKVRDMPPALSRRSLHQLHSPSARHEKNSLNGKPFPGVPEELEKVPDTTPPAGQTTSPSTCPGKVSQGLERFLRLLQKEIGLRNAAVSDHPPPPPKSASPPDARDEDSRVLKRAFNGGEEVPHSPSAPLQRSVSPLVQKNNVPRGQEVMPTKREAKSPDSAPPPPPQSVSPTVAEDKSGRGFQLFLSLLNKGADMVPDILTVPRQRSSSPPRQKDQVRGFHSEGEKGGPNFPTLPPERVSPNRRAEFGRGLERPLNPGATSVDHPAADMQKSFSPLIQKNSSDAERFLTKKENEVPNMSSAPPHKGVSPSTKQEKISKGFECFLSLLNKGVDMEQLHRIVNEPSENHLSGGTSNWRGLKNDTTSQECKRRNTNEPISKDQSPHLGGSEAAVKRRMDGEDCSGKPGFQPDSLSRKRSKDDFLTFSDQTESSFTSRTASRCHRSKSPLANEDQKQTRALGSWGDIKCPLVEKAGIASQHISSQTLKYKDNPSDPFHLRSTTPGGSLKKADRAGQTKSPESPKYKNKTRVLEVTRSPSKSLPRAAKTDEVGLDASSRSRSKSPLPRKSKGKASSKSTRNLDSRNRSRSPREVTPDERKSFGSRSRHRSETPEKKVVEMKHRSDDKQLQLQSILSTLGLDLGANDLSGVAARTQERLYGKKTDNKTVSGSSPMPKERQSADKSGRSRDRRLSRDERHSSGRRSSSPTDDRRRPRGRDTRDRRRSWSSSSSSSRSPSRSPVSPRSRSRSPGRRIHDRWLPEQSYDYSFGKPSEYNPYAPAGGPSPLGLGASFDFRGFSAPHYPVQSHGHFMEYAGAAMSSQLAYAHHPPYPPQQYYQPPFYSPGNPHIQNFKHPWCMPGSNLVYPPQHQVALDSGPLYTEKQTRSVRKSADERTFMTLASEHTDNNAGGAAQ